MYLLLSPAKSLREGPALDGYSASEPTHLSDTRALAGQLKQLSAADLKGLMGISDKLGSLNAERYQAMSFPVAMFPVLFAIPRTAGWLAQWQEMLLDSDTRIARPRQVYTGSDERKYLALGER